MRAGAARVRDGGVQATPGGEAQLRLVWTAGEKAECLREDQEPSRSVEQASASRPSLAEALGDLGPGSRCVVCGEGTLRLESACPERSSFVEPRSAPRELGSATVLRCITCGAEVERM